MNDIYELLNEKLKSLTYVGIGYVIIPSDVNREEYIENCYVNEEVSIYPETGGTCYNNVKVSVNCLNNLEFPEGGNFGSCVVYILHPTQKIPIVVGILSKKDEGFTLNYKLFKLMKSLGGNSVSITGDGVNGNLVINVHSEEDEGGQIVIDVNNFSQTGLFRLSVKGNIILLANSMFLKCKEEFDLEANKIYLKSEEFDIESKSIRFLGDKVQFHNEKIEIGKQNLEYAILGETLKNDFIIPILGILKTLNSVVSGPTAVVSPETITKVTQIEAKLPKLLSNKVKIE